MHNDLLVEGTCSCAVAPCSTREPRQLDEAPDSRYNGTILVLHHLDTRTVITAHYTPRSSIESPYSGSGIYEDYTTSSYGFR